MPDETRRRSLTLDRVLGLVGEVPDIERFPTVDDLIGELRSIAREQPSIVRWRRIGTSRLGEPIHALTVGEGAHHAVVFGGVHPNEPIGGPTAVHLARTLATDGELRRELDYTWHIVGCIDPDGMTVGTRVVGGGWYGGEAAGGAVDVGADRGELAVGEGVLPAGGHSGSTPRVLPPVRA